MRSARTLADVFDVVEPVAARIESVLGAARVVYRHGAPSGTLPDRYLLVTGSAGETSSSNLSGAADQRVASVNVTSVSQSADPAVAGAEAAWGARMAVGALTDWRPVIGRATWLLMHLASYAPAPDDDLPGAVSMALERFALTYQP